ncbi:MAG: FG-GAP-like repeat-containing protein [Polyangiales bacterium]
MHRSSLFLGLALLTLVACGDDDGGDATCSTSADCVSGQCVDGVCVPDQDAAAPDVPMPDVPIMSDAGPDSATCATAIFCGDPPICCDEGTECIEGACLAACDTGIRCDGTCCEGATDVCVDGACTAPGEECVDNFDCPEDSFCEPTLDRCLEQFDPVTCETEPVFGAFDVTPEIEISTSMRRADCLHAITTPVVVDLDGDGIPEIISNMACDSDWNDGALRAYRGDTGEELWVSDVNLFGRISIAAGDLKGDGNIVIVAMTSPNNRDPRRAIAFDAGGNELWRSTNATGGALTVGGGNGAPTLVDLDGDGSSEIVWGALTTDADGRLLWSSGTGALEGTNDEYTGGISVAGDLDGDGLMDVVSGRSAWERDGTLKWTAATPDGYPALANFDSDANPEVVLVSTGQVYVLDGATGAIEWGPTPLPGGGRGGPPTVADFDGDGVPEIGVAGGASYTVFDLGEEDGVLWSAPTIDQSSNATGSSVFDFEGDGKAEVVYQDECHVWVYGGETGEVLLQIPSSSGTIHEYPLVVDVDADGNSELITVANDRTSAARCGPGYTGRRRGLYVYGDVRDQWVRTRTVWNQHSYSVTNVTAAGGIPPVQAPNWEVEGLNNFRQNAQGEGVFNAPDLQVGLEVRLDGCPSMATLRARVSNEGNLGVEAGVPVVFYAGTLEMRGDEVGRSMTTRALLPGASEVVEVSVELPFVEGGVSFVVEVDGESASREGGVEECREDNNDAGLDGVECSLLI